MCAVFSPTVLLDDFFLGFKFWGNLLATYPSIVFYFFLDVCVCLIQAFIEQQSSETNDSTTKAVAFKNPFVQRVSLFAICLVCFDMPTEKESKHET